MKRSLFLFPKWSCLIAVLQSLGSKGFPISSSTKGIVPGLPSSGTLQTASFSFTLPSTTQLKLQLRSQSQQPSDEEKGTWPPRIRQVMGGIAVAGALETAFLTYEKLSSVANLCGTDGNCNTVLVGPYSNLPFTEIPLSAAGFVAYTVVAFLALQPLLAPDSPDDSQNRVFLTAATTSMATFSIGLLILLFGVLQTTCPYCVFSAICSVLLAKLAWILGLPKEEEDTNGAAAGTVSTGFLTAIVGTVLLFVSAEPDFSPSLSLVGDSSFLDTSMTLLASSATKQQQQQQLYSPPEITTDSSRRALELATSLQALDAKMYGAYWCSHCYDQKEVLGKQAFGKITYVECSKDGVNSQAKLCRSREVPGYPTWEIQGQLYPGQQDLEELEELVQTIRSGGGSTAATPVLPSS